MESNFPREILRPDGPTDQSFTVSEVVHQAKLDQNESPWDAPQEFKERILHDLDQALWNRYPQPAHYAKVKVEFAAAIGQLPERVVITAGCDQMILLAYWAAGGRGRRTRIFEPTYPMIAAYGRTTQTDVDQVVLGPDFDVAAHGLGDAVDLLILVSPNNPTGDGPDRKLILQALERPCLVFLDEAYADFAGRSMVDLVSEHPNLLVGRSLSKSLLAGVRLGYGVGHPELIRVLEGLLFAPYHLSFLQLLAARYYWMVLDKLKAMVTEVVAQRERVVQLLGDLGIKVWPSRANFLLFEVDEAKRCYQALLEDGIRVRDVSSMPGMGEHLRVTLGTAYENNLFLKAIKKIVFPTRDF